MLHEQEINPVRLLCRLLELPRSSYYYQPVQVDESDLDQVVQEVAGRFPTYGSRRIARQMRRAPYRIRVNRKRVQRIMRRLDLLKPLRKRKKQTTRSDHGFARYPNRVKGLKVDRPDQVWVADITYIRLGEGFVYLAVIMDVYTRSIRGWNLSRSLDQELTRKALRDALEIHRPEIHHSDQGVHYAVSSYVALLEQHGAQISMAAVGRADENGYAERLIRTIKEEEVDLSEYRNYFEAFMQIGQFIEDVYQTKRIHSALGYLTPAEFEADYQLNPATARSPLILL